MTTSVLFKSNGIYFGYCLCGGINVNILVGENNKITPKYTYIRGWKLIESFTKKYVAEHPLKANDTTWCYFYGVQLQKTLEELFPCGVRVNANKIL